ncbi:hypothetical protein EVAR_41927_1 [Eumeta japonica]|uniref:Uncharacterized protein n=1 Tax=Eumeta variegata TaxID=151549 RepID=A0A4C1XM31_EUMVA|nr:hypothetical protein EVAR_41927_1 [Eumeta japonica]
MRLQARPGPHGLQTRAGKRLLFNSHSYPVPPIPACQPSLLIVKGDGARTDAVSSQNLLHQVPSVTVRCSPSEPYSTVQEAVLLINQQIQEHVTHCPPIV